MNSINKDDLFQSVYQFYTSFERQEKESVVCL